VFLGLYEHSLDEKGRLVLPRKFRVAFAEGCVVAKAPDDALQVWPKEGFKAYAAQLSSLSGTSAKVRVLRRSMLATAWDDVPDRQGRISIPDVLCRYAAIDSQVVVTGAEDHLELWAPATWALVEEADDAIYRTLDEDLDTIGVSS